MACIHYADASVPAIYLGHASILLVNSAVLLRVNSAVLLLCCAVRWICRSLVRLLFLGISCSVALLLSHSLTLTWLACDAQAQANPYGLVSNSGAALTPKGVLFRSRATDASETYPTW